MTGSLAFAIANGVDDSTDLKAIAADLFAYRSKKGTAAWNKYLHDTLGGDKELHTEACLDYVNGDKGLHTQISNDAGGGMN